MDAVRRKLPSPGVCGNSYGLVSPEGYDPFRTETYYFFEAAARFDALSGLSFCACSTVLRSRWVAKLQSPRAHFVGGFGATAQNVPSEEVTVREQPSQVPTTGWQRPPLKLHPFLVMNTHSNPFFNVIHCIIFPPVLLLMRV